MVPGTWGYVDEIGVGRGEEACVRVSAPAAFTVEFLRLRTGVLRRGDGDLGNQRSDVEMLTKVVHRRAAPQKIAPGSYIWIDGDPVDGGQLTLGLWLRLWRAPVIDTLQWNWSGLITDFDYPSACRFALLITHEARPALYVGDGKAFRLEWLHVAEATLASRLGEWILLTASVASDGSVVIYANGERALGARGRAVPVAAGPTSRLRIGASAEAGEAANFLDADISLPFIGGFALTEKLALALTEAKTLSPIMEAHPRRLWGYWPLDEEGGERIDDHSGSGRHGILVNGGDWEIGGPAFDAAQGLDYRPRDDSTRGHGLRLASDDLLDCEWELTDTWAVPHDAPGGLYAARIRLAGAAIDTALDIPFTVTGLRPRTQNSAALLVNTNTWHAYGRIPENEVRVPGLNSSFYTHHRSGKQFFRVGLRLPIPHAIPYGYESARAARTGHSHLVRPELMAQAWLESEAVPFECLTDLDLHRSGSALSYFQALVICGHSEYWSDAMRSAVEQYLAHGGRVICLSGNTLYWRVSFGGACGWMESRKLSLTAEGEWLPPDEWGERWHSNRAGAGGPWELLDQPASALLGLDMQGMIDDGAPEAFSPFEVVEPSHRLFRHPWEVPISNAGTIGEMSLNGPKASGYEMDALRRDPAPGMKLLARATGQRLLESAGSPHRGADIVYWKRPAGGEVFAAGSVGFSGALLVDEGVRMLMRNVLNLFGLSS